MQHFPIIITIQYICKCNLPAKCVEVKKDGPTKGKLFYACSNLQSNANILLEEY
jgi:hypothetical protein